MLKKYRCRVNIPYARWELLLRATFPLQPLLRSGDWHRCELSWLLGGRWRIDVFLHLFVNLPLLGHTLSDASQRLVNLLHRFPSQAVRFFVVFERLGQLAYHLGTETQVVLDSISLC